MFSMWDQLSEYLVSSKNQFSVSEERLALSHKRCVNKHDINPKLAMLGDIFNGADLKSFLKPYTDIIPKSRHLFSAIMETMQDKKFVFILTDAKARIIELFATSEVVSGCEKQGVRPGGSLSEKSCGTNAVSLALYYREPVVLKGGHHFADLFRDWYCAAVPIVNSENQPIGCIDFSMSHKADIGEKLAFVKVVAAQLADIMKPMPYGQKKLSPRQNQILWLLSSGVICKELASHLKIKPSTVETHLSALKIKFGCETTYELLAKFGRIATPPVVLKIAPAKKKKLKRSR